MAVPMVEIGIVDVGVDQRRVPMDMRVWFARQPVVGMVVMDVM